MTRSLAIGRPGLLIAAFVVGFGLTVSTQAPSGQADQQSPPAQPGQSQADDHPKLPPGEGRDLMIRVCSKCHSPDSAADQQLDVSGWKDLVDEMASNGADATDEEFDQIVHYLANAFPPSK